MKLSAEPRRLSELRNDIPRISAKVLTAKLRALEANGVVTRTPVASSPPVRRVRADGAGP